MHSSLSAFFVSFFITFLLPLNLPLGCIAAGFAGSAPIAIGGGSVGDLFSERERAGAMSLYSLGPLIGKSSSRTMYIFLKTFAGPVVGPIAGGFITQSIGLKWVFIVIACLCASASVIGIPILRETYAPIIRLRLAKSADLEKAAKEHLTLVASHGSKLDILWMNLSRPAIILTRSFICFILSLYMALCVVFRNSLLGIMTQNLFVVCMRCTTSCSQHSQPFSQKFMGQYFVTSIHIAKPTRLV